MIRQRLKRWFYGRCPGFAGVFPYYGTKVYFPKDCLLFDMACAQGTYERGLVEVLTRLTKEHTYYFDVGANIGLMSVPILYARSTCRVVSFEPSPNAFPWLRKTWKASLWKDRWQVACRAISDTIGETEFCVAAPRLGCYDGISDTGRAGQTAKTTVPTATLDQQWSVLGQPSVSVIKIDIEGAELPALKGARRLIEAERPCVILEWNQINLRAHHCLPGTLLEFASGLQYEVLAFPSFAPVKSPDRLRFFMALTESFVLVPEAASERISIPEPRTERTRKREWA